MRQTCLNWCTSALLLCQSMMLVLWESVHSVYRVTSPLELLNGHNRLCMGQLFARLYSGFVLMDCKTSISLNHENHKLVNRGLINSVCIFLHGLARCARHGIFTVGDYGARKTQSIWTMPLATCLTLFFFGYRSFGFRIECGFFATPPTTTDPCHHRGLNHFWGWSAVVTRPLRGR